MSLAARLAGRAADALLLRDLRRAFRRVVWLGPWPLPPPVAPDDRPRPVVLYANHHYALDAYLMRVLLTHGLGRPTVVWMEEWERAPVFGPLGALPFPADDVRARTRTVRETARRMTADPATALFLYPEGTLGPPDAGVAPFRADLPRLARLLPADTLWWPVAVRATWWGETMPTALLTGGEPHESPDGDEPARINTLLARLQDARPTDLEEGRAHVLLDGKKGAEEAWDLSALAPLYRRLTFGARSKGE